MSEVLRRAARLAARLSVVPEVDAVDPDRISVSHGRGGHGKHGATSVAPTGRRSDLDAFLDALDAVVSLHERRFRAVYTGSRLTPEEAALARDDRITTEHRGKPAEWVAVVEDCGIDTVRRARREAGQRPSNGKDPRHIEVDPLIDDIYGE